MYFEGEVPAITYGNGYNNNGFGNGWEGLIGLALVASLFGGWGGFGFGGRGSYGPAPATQADLAAGFNNSAVLSSLNDIKLGQTQMQNFINQGFSGINTSLMGGFHGVDNAICTLGYNMASGFNSLGHQISDCCCSTKSAIADLKYATEKQTQTILDYMQTEKINALTAENVALKGRISNDAQSAYIIDRLTPCPRPAYIVPNPNCCYTQCGGVAIQ